MKPLRYTSLLLTLALAAAPAFGGQVTDMAGRTVTAPDAPTRVYGSAPPLNALLHAIAPETMMGFSFPVPPEGVPYYPPELAKLPVLGGVFGMGPQMSSEAVMAHKPDLALAWKSPQVDAGRIQSAFDKMGVPVVFIKLDKLADWPAALRFTGKLLGHAQKGEDEAKYVEEALAKLAKLQSIPEAKRLRVYYAETPAGLATECNQSFHAETIELAAGWNVYRCAPKTHMGMEGVSMEQLLLWQPDVILTHDRAFAATVKTDERWQRIKAVKEGKILVAPRFPHNWIDRPPSMMRALGAQWLANKLYPQEYPLDVAAETRRFYKLFFDMDLSDEKLNGLFE
jgi:iron complex transport system substrate-binding protein